MKQRKRGQISVLIVFSLIPMFTLFAFVINIGMLVNAKISLQNATDAAVYAGAASQARMMTDIAHLNYYMRMVYKKFIYKYYVLGNVSQKCFPKKGGALPGVCNATVQTGSNKAFDWQNVSSSGTPGFPGVPVVCISLSKESNPCQVAQAVPVVQPPQCNPVDPACNALRQAAIGIGAIQLASCESNSAINQEVLANWMYATNFDVTLKTNANLQGLISDDIGLVTEELLTLERINNIVATLNTPAVKAVTAATARSMQEGPDPIKVERTLLAFHSLANNLNTQVFQDRDEIVMTELLEMPLILVKPIKVPDMQAAYTFMKTGASGNCDMEIADFRASPMVGVVKNPASHVYYAIRTKAKARLLFNPFPFGSAPAESIELTAYAAAMPFGSRIGPDLLDKVLQEFVIEKKALANSGARPTIRYPHLKMDDEHTTESIDVLEAMFDTISSGVGPGNIDRTALETGIHAALIPDDNEIGRYSIPVDSDTIGQTKEGREFHSYFSENGGPATKDPYVFWAPIVSVGGNDAFTERMGDAMEGMAANATEETGNARLDGDRRRMKGELIGKIGGLFSALKSSAAFQGFHVFRMPDPLSTAFFGAKFPGIPGKVKSGDPKISGPILASSFSTNHEASYFANGRDGYSVKLVPLKMILSSPGKVSNDINEAKWKAVTDGFEGERGEMQKVAH